VTLTLERVEDAPPVVPATPRRRLFLTLLPWIVPALAWAAGLHHTATPDRDIVLYAAYLAVAIALPGTLVFRALLGSRGNLPEDLGLGSAAGLFVLIVGWAICAATRLQTFLVVWPLLAIALFLAVPRLRRFWRIPRDVRRPLPMHWSWIVAAGALVVVIWAYPSWRDNPLPPATWAYYQDLMYHLALVHEMTRSIPFQVPQLAGDTLRYHYLSDADMAAASMITKIPAATILLRLWIVPIVMAAVLVCATITRQVTGKAWAGALGGIAAVFALPLGLGTVTNAYGASPIAGASPSQTYAIPMLGLLIVVALEVLRGRRLAWWAWVAVFPLALACAGAKSSALPPFVAGLVLAVVVLFFRYRDRFRAGLLLLGLTLAGMLVGMKVFAGGGAGTLAVQPFSILIWFTPYRQTIGADDPIDSSMSLPLGLSEHGIGGLVFALGILGWWLLVQSPRLLGVLALTTRRPRADPAAWLLGGIGVAGTGAAFLLWHPSASQIYFFLSAAPFAALLTVWFLADQARTWRPVVAGLAAGALWALFAPRGVSPEHKEALDWAWALAEPILLTAAVAAVVGVVVLLAWRALSGRFAWRAIPAGLIAAVLGASLAASANGNVERADADKAKLNAKYAVTANEMRAALWLGAHSGRDDLIATNVHCQPVASLDSACDARAFWVSGLSGRRALVESWGYTDQAVAANWVDGKRYFMQPAPYPDRFALNQRVFAQGDAADVDKLRTEYHVKWLLADWRAAGSVSPELAKVAHLRYQAGSVSVYEL
jgi:hypothetical protein